ncbi:MAG: hydroxymethylglutaryl-CoA synthase family protein [Bacillota bacterium]
MVGITATGVYIPRYRLAGDTWGQVWGKKGAGEKAVANYDEDSITLAVSAVDDCLAGLEPRQIDGLFFASTTSPYAEKLNAAVVATTCDLRRDVLGADFTGSLRAGVSAIRAAVDAIRGGSARSVAVVASDCRLAEPGSEGEMGVGDGAAAVLVGTENVIAEFEASYSLTEEFIDAWRRDDDPYIQNADARFVQLYGYERCLVDVVNGLLQKTNLTREQISKVVVYAPDARTLQGLTKVLKFPAGAIVDDVVMRQAGNMGTAAALMTLVSALQSAQPGERILLAGYGTGAEAILFQVTAQISKFRSTLQAQLDDKRVLPHYGYFLKFRELLGFEKLVPYTSEILLWRDQKANLQLYGQKCTQCGATQYPPRRVCWQCNSKDTFEDVKLSRTGKVVTFTKDTLAPSADPPVIMAVVDLDAGGRIYAQVTDCEEDRVSIGMTVGMTFRKYHEGGGFHNYFWKFRPQRSGKEG